MDIQPPTHPLPQDGPKPLVTSGGAPPMDHEADKPAADTSKGTAPDNGPHPWSMNDIPPATPADTSPQPIQTGGASESSSSMPFANEPSAPVVSDSLAPAAPEPPAGLSHMPASAAPDAAPVVAATPLPVAAQHKKKKTKLVALIVVLLVIVLGAGSAAAYVGYYLPNQPQNVLGKALLNTLSPNVIKTANFEGKLDITGKDGKPSGGMTYTGKVNQEGAFDVSAKVDAVVANITVDSRSVDGKSYYVRVGGLDGLAPLLSKFGSEAAQFAPIINAVNNQWFEINESLIKQYTHGSSTKLSDADRQKIVDAYKKNQFIVVKTVLPSQDIKGVSTYHYKLGVDNVKAKAFVADIKNAKLDSIKLTDEDVKLFNSSADKGNFDKTLPELWITKDTKLIKQVQLATSENGQSVSFVFTVDNYNQPIKVEKPANAKSILELLQMVLGTGLMTQQSVLPTQGISL